MKIEYNDLSGWLKFAVFGAIIHAFVAVLIAGAVIVGVIAGIISLFI
jgi:hypothetical protein